MEIRSLISQTLEHIAKMERLRKIDDFVKEAALRWLLYIAHQNILDALAALVCELGLRKPPTYAGLGDVLYENGYVDERLRDAIKLIARTRNLLAHEYRRLSIEDLLRIREESTQRMREVVKAVANIIEKLGIDPEPPEDNRCAAIFAKYGIRYAILFGSRARGDAREESDYDIAIYAERRLDVSTMNELALELAEALGVPPDKVDLVDLRDAPNELLYKVLRDGKIIYAEDRESCRRWIIRSYIRILDEEEGFLRSYYPRLLRKLRREGGNQ